MAEGRPVSALDSFRPNGGPAQGGLRGKGRVDASADPLETAGGQAARAARPQVLLLVHRVPYPPNRGDRIRSFRLLDFLAARADVSLAFLADQPPPRETMRVLESRCRRVAAVPLCGWARWARGAWSLVRGGTATEGLFRSPRLRRMLRRWAGETRFDAVVAFCSSTVQYLDLPGLDDVPAVVDLVDVDSQKWHDYAAHARGLRRWLFATEARRLRRLVASLPGRAEAITVVSRAEAKVFASFCPSHRLHVLPNGVDLDYFRPADPPPNEAAERCVFVGALDYRANVDGLAWFCREVWPEVRRRFPQSQLQIVGSDPGPAAARLAEAPGVELLGTVPDVRPFLAEAALVVVPLRIARGIQNKVLEALAMGKAVVATPQALEGTGAAPGVHACQAATAEAWRRQIVELLADPRRRQRLGLQGRKFVERHYCWATRAEMLEHLPGLKPLFHSAPPAPPEMARPSAAPRLPQ